MLLTTSHDHIKMTTVNLGSHLKTPDRRSFNRL